MARSVAEARQGGASWTDIGRRLGVSRQAAQQRYSAIQERISVSDLLTSIPRPLPPRAQAAVHRAVQLAKEGGQDALYPQHLLLGILGGPGVALDALHQMGVPAEALAQDLRDSLPPATHPASADLPVSDQARRLVDAAVAHASRLFHNYLGTEHLLLAMGEDPTLAPVLAGRGASASRIRATVEEEIARLSPR